MLHRVQAAGDELDDYGPHVYAEEGVAEADYELDVIPLPDITFDQNMDLDYRFKDLASVSMTHKSFPVQKTFITNESSSTTETTVMMYESAIDAMESKNTQLLLWNICSYVDDMMMKESYRWFDEWKDSEVDAL